RQYWRRCAGSGTDHCPYAEMEAAFAARRLAGGPANARDLRPVARFDARNGRRKLDRGRRRTTVLAVRRRGVQPVPVRRTWLDVTSVRGGRVPRANHQAV